MSRALLICPADGIARNEAQLDSHLEFCGHCTEFIQDMAMSVEQTKEILRRENEND